MSGFHLQIKKFWLIFWMFGLFLIIDILVSRFVLATTHFELTSSKIDSFTTFRILQLSDLHNSEFGSHNTRLIATVQSEAPDFILLTGDLLNSDEERTDIATNLIRQLCKIAPVYCSNGNHEIEYQQKYGTDVDELYQSGRSRGVWKRSIRMLIVKGQKIRIGRNLWILSCRGNIWRQERQIRRNVHFWTDFQNTELPTFLMCHMPVCWMINGSLDEWKVDYVFAGHVHGGEVIFPFIGGLYGPDLGWFPGRMEGIYSSEDGTRSLILSRGLGTNEKIPRFHNIPEIVVADIQGKG